MGHPKQGMIGLVNDFQEYEPDVFFNVQNLSLEQKKKLLRSAYNKRIGFHVDMLDAEKSFSRKEINMSFEEILQKLKDSSHFVFIDRKGFKKSDGKPMGKEEYVLEIGFSESEDQKNYYLFIFCDRKEISYFINTFQLSTR